MRVAVSVGLALGLLLLAPWTSWAADIDADEVDAAIKKGVAYLKREQSPRGTWTDHGGQPGGVTALNTLAMLAAGEPPDDPSVARALTALRKIKPDKTYAVALQTMAFCAATPKQDLPLIGRNARWLEETQIKEGNRAGCWGYPGRGGDNSNAQFAMLALHEAERAGVKIKLETWRKSLRYWRASQRPDGSWGYVAGMAGSGSMTCAGLAGLVITSGKITAGDASLVGGSIHCCGQQQDDEHLERGLAWMGRNFSVANNPGTRRGSGLWLYYYLYGLERVGRLTAQRFIGKHDWYREGAEKLLKDQDGLSGFWKGSGHVENHPHVGTPLALLFLAKGRRPVVAAKLVHGPGKDWNHHRSDLANLTIYTEKKWEMDLSWQVVDPKAAQVEDLLQSPVLYISGHKPPQMSADEIVNLRAYIDRGGFVFAVDCCAGDGGFDAGFRRLMDQVFPEQEYQLEPLSPNHPVWAAEEEVEPQIRPLWGIEYGCRTSVIYCPEDLSCLWELSRSGRGRSLPAEVREQIAVANALGVNVLTYATGREPKYKGAVPAHVETDVADATTLRNTVYVAKLQHPGGCNAAPTALANLLRRAGRDLEMRVSSEDRQLSITDKHLFRYHLVFMHGRHNFRLTPAERQALRTYLERGGTMFVDSICASRPFTESFRREMKQILPDHALERIPVGDPLFGQEFGGADIRTVTRRNPMPRKQGEPLRAKLGKVEPELEAVKIGDRYRVIFSPYDISCALEQHKSAECHGYIPEDAERIGINVILYSLHR